MGPTVVRPEGKDSQQHLNSIPAKQAFSSTAITQLIRVFFGFFVCLFFYTLRFWSFFHRLMFTSTSWGAVIFQKGPPLIVLTLYDKMQPKIIPRKKNIFLKKKKKRLKGGVLLESCRWHLLLKQLRAQKTLGLIIKDPKRFDTNGVLLLFGKPPRRC